MLVAYLAQPHLLNGDAADVYIDELKKRYKRTRSGKRGKPK
jgi:hypothetical protein